MQEEWEVEEERRMRRLRERFWEDNRQLLGHLSEDEIMNISERVSNGLRPAIPDHLVQFLAVKDRQDVLAGRLARSNYIPRRPSGVGRSFFEQNANPLFQYAGDGCYQFTSVFLIYSSGIFQHLHDQNSQDTTFLEINAGKLPPYEEESIRLRRKCFGLVLKMVKDAEQGEKRCYPEFLPGEYYQPALDNINNLYELAICEVEDNNSKYMILDEDFSNLEGEGGIESFLIWALIRSTASLGIFPLSSLIYFGVEYKKFSNLRRNVGLRAKTNDAHISTNVGNLADRIVTFHVPGTICLVDISFFVYKNYGGSIYIPTDNDFETTFIPSGLEENEMGVNNFENGILEIKKAEKIILNIFIFMNNLFYEFRKRVGRSHYKISCFLLGVRKSADSGVHSVILFISESNAFIQDGATENGSGEAMPLLDWLRASRGRGRTPMEIHSILGLFIP